MEYTGMEVAVIGMAVRMPGIENIDEFWESIIRGKVMVRRFSEEELLSKGINPELLSNPNYVKVYGELQRKDFFDGAFFGYTPMEAEKMLPQTRLLHELVWAGIEDAGYLISECSGKIGLYLGANSSSYWEVLNALSDNNDMFVGLSSATLTNKDHAASRISYNLNLKGPSMTLDTACSTSLVAVHLACQAVLAGDCDIAVAGGMSISVHENHGYLYQEGDIYSKSGYCKPFDQRADGTVRGDGGGVVVLKLLDKAIEDGDQICAIIKGSAINNDGRFKAGYTAPSAQGQADVMQKALLASEVASETVTYIETHGTGTHLGDAIEIEGLKAVYGLRHNQCHLGSIKANIGHLIHGAGIAGLIKTVLCLKWGMIPPMANYESPNPVLNYESCPFVIGKTAAKWEGAFPLRAGVSSFGIGGTNAHVIVEQASVYGNAAKEADTPNTIVLSAKDEEGVMAAAANLEAFLRSDIRDLPAVAYTYQMRKQAFEYRTSIAYKNAEDLIDTLDKDLRIRKVNNTAPRICFLFAGQGAQYINMGINLYRQNKRFMAALDQCLAIYRKLENSDLLDFVFAKPSSKLSNYVYSTRYAQPLLFSFEYALAQYLIELGIEPDNMVGHSIGEYAAACIAGVFLLEDAMKLVIYRGKLMQGVPEGSMASVEIGYDELLTHLLPGVSIAAVNSTTKCVVSGEESLIERQCSILEQFGYHSQKLKVSHAFHSHMMEPILSEFTDKAAMVEINMPNIPYMSNLSGKQAEFNDIKEPMYWSNHIRGTVLMEKSLNNLLSSENDWLFIEIGPGRALGSFVTQHERFTSERHKVLSTMPHAKEEVDDNVFFCGFLGNIWSCGVEVKWEALYDWVIPEKISVPTYPFQGKRYWIDESIDDIIDSRKREHSVIKSSKKTDISKWFYLPGWSKAPMTLSGLAGNHERKRILVFANDDIISDKILSRVSASNDVIVVRRGRRYQKRSDALYNIEPSHHESYKELYEEIFKSGDVDVVLNLWCMAEETVITGELNVSDLYLAQHYGLYVLLYAAKSISAIGRSAKVFLCNVTTQMEDVTGSECIQSHYATVISPIKCISQEFTNFHCKNVDVVITADASTDRIVDSICMEILYEDSEHQIAYRNGRRYCRTYRNITLPPCEETGAVKHGGTYWILGGTGYIGMQTAEYLAKKYSANILLMGKSDYPDAEEWKAWVDSKNQNDVKALFTAIKNKRLQRKAFQFNAARYKEVFDILPMLEYKYDEFDKKMNNLCAVYIFNCFKRMGIEITKGAKYTESELFGKAMIVEPLSKYFRLFMHVLEKENYISCGESGIVFNTSYDKLPNHKQIMDDISILFPEWKGTIRLLDTCANSLFEVMRGIIPPALILFPTGDTAYIEEILSMNTVVNSNTLLLMNELKKLFADILSKAERKIRILEVGGGSGQLLNALSHLFSGDNVEYWFTDISENLLETQKRRSVEKGWGFIRFKKFDISKDAYEQGFEAADFDIILGYNVVHATPDLRDTVANLKKLLALNGLMMLMEDVKQRTWLDMIWGYANGWWSFKDEDMRYYSPIATAAQWKTVFEDCDMENIIISGTAAQNENHFDVAIIMGQRRQFITVDEIDKFYPSWSEEASRIKDIMNRVDMMNQSSGRVVITSVDLTDVKRLEDTVNKSRLEFGDPDGLILAAGKTKGYRTIMENETDQDYFNSFLSIKAESIMQCERVLGKLDLDFRMVISSISSVFGGLAHAAYTAGHMFSDAHATRLNRMRGQKWISVNWSSWSNWSEISKDNEQNGLGKAYQRLAMTPDESIDALMRVLVNNDNETVWACFPGDFEEMERVWLKEMNTLSVKPSSSISGTQSIALPDNVLITVNEIWKVMFGRAHIDPHADFFEMGGDSLRAISIINKINQLFGMNIPLKAFYDHPTISSISRYIQSNAGGASVFKIEKAPNMEYYRASDQQKRMYVLREINPESLAYNETLVLSISGALNLDKLEMAIRQVIDLHECLRSSIMLVINEIVQKVWENVDFEMIRIRVSMSDADSIINSLIKPFTAESKVQIRAYVLEIHESLYRLVLDMPHTVTDMISSKILLRDLLLCYKGTPPEKALIQYKDYVYWQESKEYQELLSKQKSFWMSEFKEVITPLNIPYDHNKNENGRFSKSSYSIVIASDKCKCIRSFIEAEKVTLFAFLFTSYAVFLSKLCDAQDVVIGTPVINRRNEQLSNVMGMFVNTLPIRIIVDHDCDMKGMLHTVMEKCVQCFDSQEYDFLRIINDIADKRPSGQNEIFNVIFGLLNDEGDKARLEEVHIEGLDIEEYEYTTQTAKFDLTLTAREENDLLRLSFEYNADVFDSATIVRYAEYYLKLIDVMMERKDDIIGQVDMFSYDERVKLLYTFNGTDREVPSERTATSFFLEQVKKFSHSTVAVVHNNLSATYQELDICSDKIAEYLRENGVKNNVCVCLIANRGIELIKGLLGILKAGGVYVPIDPSLPLERRKYIIQDCSAVVLLTDEVNKTDNYSAITCTSIDRILSEREHVGTINDINTPQDIAYVIYTSGSTGVPKGVAVEHKSIISHTKWMERCFKLDENHTILQKTPISFDVSIWEVFFWLHDGTKLAILDQWDEKDPAAIIKCINKHKVTAVHFVPSMLREFLRYAVIRSIDLLSSLKYIFSGGEMLTPQIVKLFDDSLHYNYDTQLINLYGPAETTVTIVSYNCSENMVCDVVPIGKPADNVKIYILDKHEKICPIGSIGQIYVAGAFVAREYINNKSLTDKMFVRDIVHPGERLYKTGDYGRWLPDGNIEFVGRMDTQIKIRGQRIEIMEIETHILRHEAIKNAAVLVCGNSDGKYLGAYYEKAADEEISGESLRSYLKHYLPEHMIPAQFTELEKIPRLTSGKIDREALELINENASEKDADTNLDYGDIVQCIWSDILGKPIGLNDNFFRNGGDSIKAIQIINRLYDEGYKAKISDIFDYPTPKTFLENIKKTGTEIHYSTVEGKFALTPIQKYFFARYWQNAENQFNQAIMLKLNREIPDRYINEALIRIYEHHDVLRSVFLKGQDDEIYQFIRPFFEQTLIERIDLTNAEDESAIIDMKVENIQKSLDIWNGPLVRAVLFVSENATRLFITIHHLIVDIVSWQIIIEDLTKLLWQHIQGKTMSLGYKTASFIDWSKLLYDLSVEEWILNDLAYWEQVAAFGSRCAALPKSKKADNLQRDIKRLSFSLEKVAVQPIIENMRREVLIDDVIISAISMGVNRILGIGKFNIAIENHGRALADKINVNKSVGWFTCLYPVSIELLDDEDVNANYKKISNNLRSVPNNGLSYGILKYLHQSVGLQETSEVICYNNLGSLSLTGQVQNDLLVLDNYTVRHSINPYTERPYQLEFTVTTTEDFLNLTLYYGGKQYDYIIMNELMQSINELIQEIADTISREDEHPQNIEFDYSELSDEDLRLFIVAAGE